MNRDPAYRRTRVRHELLPLLDDIAQRDVAPVLSRQAELVRVAADEIDERSAGVDPTDATRLAGGIARGRAPCRSGVAA